MTSVVANKIGLDIVDIQVEQTGSAETDMFFQEPVLNAKKDYVVGISELSIPLTHEPLMTNSSTNLDTPIMQLKKKYNGTQAQYDAGNDLWLTAGHVDTQIIIGGVLQPWSVFKLRSRNIITPVDFVRQLQIFIESISNSLDPNARSVELVISPSGIMEIQAHPNFWNFYYFELSPYGQQIFGYTEPAICFVWNQALDTGRKSSKFEDQVRKVGEGAVLDFLPSDSPLFIQWQSVRSQFSIYRYLEHRLRVELDADLSIPANILVENGNQKMHYNIASYAIPQQYEGRITTQEGYILDTVSHVSHLYVGNTILKPKESPTTDWYKLVSAANVQNMRLHVFIVRRDFNPISSKWSLTRNKLALQDDMTWFATMKFIQQF